MIILAVWVLLSFLVMAVWLYEGMGGPLEDCMGSTRQVTPVAWYLRWSWLILVPAVTFFGLILGGLSSRADWKQYGWDLWQVIVLGRRPLFRG